MSNNGMILPKLWLERIQRIWEKSVPTDYPKTSSEFSLFFADAEKDAVNKMEDTLGTSESIITEDMISKNTVLGSYLGTYNVTGTTDELTLLSPEKVPSSAIAAIAMHYNEETSSWEKIEDAYISADGYVYGTLSSFSPIAVFTIKRESFLLESSEISNGKPLYVANGIPVQVLPCEEEGKVLIKDSNGKETVVDNTVTVIGGTIDGSDVKSTSVFVKGVTITCVIAGSHFENDVVYTENASVLVEDAVIKSGVTGAGFNNRLTNFIATVKNTKANFVACGQSFWTAKKLDSNKPSPNLGSNAWVKNSVINIENSDIYIVYAGGNSGYLYVDHAELNVKGGKYGYYTVGGSNGATREGITVIEDASIDVFQTVNRGTIYSARATMRNCDVKMLAVAGDPTDSSVNGIVKNVKLDITGGNIVLHSGTNNGVAIDPISAKEIVDYVKISRTTNVEYAEGTEFALGDLIRLK